MVIEVIDVHDVEAKHDSRIKTASAHGAATIGSSDDHEGNGDPIKVVVLLLLSDGNVEHHESKHENIDELYQWCANDELCVGRSDTQIPIVVRVQHACRNASRRTATNCEMIYITASVMWNGSILSSFFWNQTAKVTAGLKWPPEMGPMA